MKSVAPEVLRAVLRTFLGDRDYRRFLDAGVCSPLKYWQERVWCKFVELHPELAVSDSEREEMLSVCPVHGSCLLVGYTADIDSGMDFAPSSPYALHNYPRAPLLRLIDGVGPRRVLYCESCVANRHAHRGMMS